jgi:alcohol dehydrogenase
VALGSSRVDYLDSSRARLEIAQSLGANPIQIQGGAAWYRKRAPRRSGPYLISVDASASIAGLNYALRSLAPGGICTGVSGYLMRKAPLPLLQMFTNSSTLHIGVAHHRADLPRLLAFLQTGKFKPEKVTTLGGELGRCPASVSRTHHESGRESRSAERRSGGHKFASPARL